MISYSYLIAILTNLAVLESLALKKRVVPYNDFNILCPSQAPYLKTCAL
jgi:hypothetical protein